jgi:hypothetical protein
MTLSRRKFLTIATTGGTSFVLASQFKNFYLRSARGQSIQTKGFGELIPDPQGILDLPKGFQYKILSRLDNKMTDGTKVPNNADGMAVFRGERGKIVLIRNHELKPENNSEVAAPESKKYDKFCKGGTTTLILNSEREVIQEYASLAGTSLNCAGGKTLWNSWISCEEIVSTPDTNPLGTPNQVSRKHGYNFEVPIRGGLTDPIPLIAMGRFRHEAVSVDPQTGIFYQTEDREDGCIYRFRPKKYRNLAAGGILEVLAIANRPQLDTSTDFPLSQPQPVVWLPIEEPDPQQDTLRYEAQSKGAAIFKRGEGMCYGQGFIYWTCTNGGNAGKGQIFRYQPLTQTVELFAESPGTEVLDYPDNLILTPFGDLMLCEDGIGEQFIVGLTTQGQFYRFARNSLNKSEFAGICFAQDGKTMFVNIYQPTITFAIWGNFINN